MSEGSSTKAIIVKQRKQDALALAQLLYDIYKEEVQSSDKIGDGQNNAQQTSSN